LVGKVTMVHCCVALGGKLPMTPFAAIIPISMTSMCWPYSSLTDMEPGPCTYFIAALSQLCYCLILRLIMCSTLGSPDDYICESVSQTYSSILW
jgi:hypothetical protein